jgi:hypothetical protein
MKVLDITTYLSDYLSESLAEEVDKTVISEMKEWMKGLNFKSNTELLRKHFPKLTTDDACNVLGIENKDLCEDINLKSKIRNAKLKQILDF